MFHYPSINCTRFARFLAESGTITDFLEDTISLDVIVYKANSIIMRTPKYSLNKLRAYLQKHVIATFKQLRQTLGQPARITLFRLLDKADGLSSYSHRGKYYTLRSIPRFNAKGLWAHQEIRFSRHGNLLQTLQVMVERSDRGHTAQELADQVGVKTKHALMQLVEQGQLQRHGESGVYVYFAAQRARVREQQQARRHKQADLPTLMLGPKARLAVEEAKAALLLFWATLDERQRRLYAGLESAKIGHGGDEHVAQLFGIDRHTVTRGREELQEGSQGSEGVRRGGGGRVRVEKKRPKS